MNEAALFVLPDIVSVPGQIVPLHFFEPRYRAMVKDCLRWERPLGLVQSTGVKAEPKKAAQSLAESLNSNHTTYSPTKIFSAGRVELVDTTADGRFIVNVHVEKRLRWTEIKQEVPYPVVIVEELNDEDYERNEKTDAQFDVAMESSQLLLKDDFSKWQSALSLETVSKKDIGTLSFDILRWLRFDGHTMQMLLEELDPVQRITRVNRLLHIVSEEMKKNEKDLD